MSTLTKIVVDNVYYYFNADLKKNNKSFYHGSGKSRDGIITKLGIPDTEYIYYNKKTGKRVETPNRLSKLLISHKWTTENIPSLMKDVERARSLIKYANAPDIIELSDEEKIKDNDGNIIEIEVRGERNVHKAFFKASDVGKACDMKNLNNVLIQINSNYQTDKDYKCFIHGADINVTPSQKDNIKLYLTYDGFLKVIYNSKKGKTDRFKNWASSIVYTHHLGTQEQRIELSKNLLMGVPIDQAISVYGTNTKHAFSAIYLLSLGQVKDLRGKIDIPSHVPDTDFIIKYGQAKCLTQRLIQHKAGFKDITDNIGFVKCNYIDPLYLWTVENCIPNVLNKNKKISINNSKEIYAASKEEIKNIKNHYDMLERMNPIHNAQIKQELDRLQLNIAKLELDIKYKDEIIEIYKERMSDKEKENQRIIAEKEKLFQLLINKLN